MKKIVYIAGTSKVSFMVQDLLNTDIVKFKGYVSFEKESGGRVVRGCYPLVSMEQLQREQYDYLLICDDVEFDESDIRNISLLNSLSVISMRLSPEYYMYRKKALSEMRDEIICGIVTGMSYVQRGLNLEQMRRRLCMCAHPCQDLYYDFFILADAVERLGDRLEYVVMGIAPYSFRYDLSLSEENRTRTLYYYREFGESHNALLSEGELEIMMRYDKVLEEVCYPAWRNICFDVLCEEPSGRSEKIFSFKNSDEEQQKRSLEQMRRIGNKPYPETVVENKMIFDMFQKLCARHGIRVTVLIPPFSEFFRTHFPADYVEETRAIIREYQEKYDFEVLDLYDSPDFTDDKYYADEDHLNVHGATKLTERLDAFLAERVYV